MRACTSAGRLRLLCAAALAAPIAACAHAAAPGPTADRFPCPLVEGRVPPVPEADCFDLQGHRGARGLAPENTIAGFAAALAAGVTTLEMDVRLTRDGVPVVFHDPRPGPDLVRIGGAWVGEGEPAVEATGHAAIRRWDVGRLRPGSRAAAAFPDQRPADGAGVPTLGEVFAAMRAANVRFNVETKVPAGADRDAVERQVRAVLDAARRHGVLDRLALQSFDWRALRIAERLAPRVPRGCLTLESGWSPPRLAGPGPVEGLDPATHALPAHRQAAAAGCTAWLPHVGDLAAGEIAEARALGLGVIPWGVEDRRVAARLVRAGIDGLITDRPDRMREALVAAGVLPPEPATDPGE